MFKTAFFSSGLILLSLYKLQKCVNVLGHKDKGTKGPLERAPLPIQLGSLVHISELTWILYQLMLCLPEKWARDTISPPQPQDQPRANGQTNKTEAQGHSVCEHIAYRRCFLVATSTQQHNNDYCGIYMGLGTPRNLTTLNTQGRAPVR